MHARLYRILSPALQLQLVVCAVDICCYFNPFFVEIYFLVWLSSSGGGTVCGRYGFESYGGNDFFIYYYQAIELVARAALGVVLEERSSFHLLLFGIGNVTWFLSD